MIIAKSFEKTESTSPLLVGAFLDEEVQIAPAIDLEIKKMLAEKEIGLEKGKVNKIFTFGKIPNKSLYLIGLGKKENYDYEVLEECLRKVNYKLGKELVVELDSFIKDLNPNEAVSRFIKTVGFYNYVYDELLSEKIDNELNLKFYTKFNLEKEIEEAFILANAVDNTRDLVNKPYNYLSALELAEYAEGLAKSLDDERVTVKVYNKKEIEALEMNAFLGVNKGSKAEPRLIHLKYRGADTKPIGLVGKGVMYDTGGYSLKSQMNNMKSDMAGAAAALGALKPQ